MTISMAAAVDVSAATMLTSLPTQSRLSTGADRQSLTQWINRIGAAMQHLGIRPQADWSTSHQLLGNFAITADDSLALRAGSLCRWGIHEAFAPGDPPVRRALIDLPPPLSR